MRFANPRFWSFLTIVVGSLSWSLTMVKSGLIYPFGMGFWGPNGHDGIWHLALINHLASGSFGIPVFAGEALRNYHWFYDGFLALIHRVTTIPAQTLYFQFFPPIMALLIGWLTYKLVRRWQKSELAALFSLFFVYFSGSFGWLVAWVRQGNFGGESMFWANQAVSTLINPPFAASLILLLAGLILFLEYQKNPTTKLFALQAILFGILIGVKAYAGVITLIGLAAASVFDRKVIRLFVASLLVALLVFLPTNRSSTSLLVFSPFWFPETMAAFADRFNWPRLANAIAAYKSGGNFLKLIPAEILALSIFLVGNFGTRILGLGLISGWVKNFKKLSAFEVMFLTIIAAGIVLPLLFIQKGNPWNTIQFLYYSLFLLGVTAGMLVGGWLARGRQKLAPALLILGLTLPTTINTLTSHYLPQRPPAAIPHEELETLSFLGKQPDGTVLTYPFNPNLRRDWEPPQPLWVYETTAYVSAFSGKPTFLEDEMNLEITGYNWRPRRAQVEDFFKSLSPEDGKEFLKASNVSYIYLTPGQNLPLTALELELEELFNLAGVRIYRALW